MNNTDNPWDSDPGDTSVSAPDADGSENPDAEKETPAGLTVEQLNRVGALAVAKSLLSAPPAGPFGSRPVPRADDMVLIADYILMGPVA